MKGIIRINVIPMKEKKQEGPHKPGAEMKRDQASQLGRATKDPALSHATAATVTGPPPQPDQGRRERKGGEGRS